MTEWELLLALVRPHSDTVEIRRLIASGVDWERFQQLSNRHDLNSFAASQLLKLAPDLLPAAVAEGIRLDLMKNTARQMRAEHQLAGLAKAFSAEGLPLLSFKGPTLVQMLYRETSLREYVDLDVMVHPRDVPASRDLLARLGYTTEFTGSNPVTAPVTRFSKELAFYQEGLHPIDLHWELSSDLMPSPLDVRAVWERAGSVQLNGVAVGTLGREDQLVYLCYHGGKHLWCTLSQVCDAGWLIAKHPELDWEETLNRAHRSGCRRLVLLGVQLGVELLSVETPDPVRSALSSRTDVGAAAQLAKNRLRNENGPTMGDSTHALFGLLENPAQKFQYVVGIALAPTLAEWRDVPLPESLYWLYYPLRIARLGWKYFRLGMGRIFQLFLRKRRAD